VDERCRFVGNNCVRGVYKHHYYILC